MQCSGSTRREMWKQSYMKAGTVLSVGGNRLLLTEALILSLLPIPFCAVVFSSAMLPAQVLSPLGYKLVAIGGSVIVFSLFLFFAIPLWLGNFYLAHRISEGKDVSLSDLFHAFSAKNTYRSYLGTAFRFCWRLVLTAIVLFYVFLITELCFRMDIFLFPRPFLFLVRGIAVAVAALFWMRRFPQAFAAVLQEICPEKDRHNTIKHFSAPAASGWIFFVGFLPWVLLGVVTVGISLLWETFPRMLLTYDGYCRTLGTGQ